MAQSEWRTGDVTDITFEREALVHASCDVSQVTVSMGMDLPRGRHSAPVRRTAPRRDVDFDALPVSAGPSPSLLAALNGCLYGRSRPGFANSSFLRNGTPSVIHSGAGAPIR